MALASVRMLRDARGSFADHEFGFNDDFAARIRSGGANPAEQGFGGFASHFAKRLAYRRQGGILVSGALDVIEAYDRDIAGHLQVGFPQRANRTHRGYVIERE